MKAFSLIVLMLIFGVALEAVPFLVPSYNNGNGLSAGNQSGLAGEIANWQLSGGGLLASKLTQNTGLDILTYLFVVFISSLVMLIQIFTIALVSYPLFVAVFSIPVQISAGLQVLITGIEVFGVYQVWRGTVIIQE